MVDSLLAELLHSPVWDPLVDPASKAQACDDSRVSSSLLKSSAAPSSAQQYPAVSRSLHHVPAISSSLQPVPAVSSSLQQSPAAPSNAQQYAAVPSSLQQVPAVSSSLQQSPAIVAVASTGGIAGRSAASFDGSASEESLPSEVTSCYEITTAKGSHDAPVTAAQSMLHQPAAIGDGRGMSRSLLDNVRSTSASTPPSELLTVSAVLAAQPGAVAAALDEALLSGRPGEISGCRGLTENQVKELCCKWLGVGDESWGKAAKHCLEAVNDAGYPVPYPVAAEWTDFVQAGHKFDAQQMYLGALYCEVVSHSQGLRPLRHTDQIAEATELDKETISFKVMPKHRGASQISVLSHWVCEDWGSQDAAHGYLLRVSPLDDSFVSNLRNAGGTCSWYTLKCEVKPIDGGLRTQISRTLLNEGLVSETQGKELVSMSTKARGTENFIVGTCRQISWNLEFELRAWLACQSFPLVEVWRRLRQPEAWAVTSSENCVAPFALCSGHAGYAEIEVWPTFDTAHAHMLLQGLKDYMPAILTVEDNCSKGILAEGNVQIESFAGLLDRITRRATTEADIFRRFVDLGSGRGLAVITAHALFPFLNCVGVEIVPECVASARALAQRYIDLGLSQSAKAQCDPAQLFVEGDLANDLDWSDASVVFVNCVTWPANMIKLVTHRALSLQRGAVLLTTKRFPADMEVSEAFCFRGEAILGDWSQHVVRMWVYRRI
eukprot:TRINITY_DN27938_c0_g1_i1.p1 TRINITY_DN27938_c0_g1~~TRINITY_DN27938_c0_g1_i1.p1  ORF type:complete len:719 (+),score=118.69 TRINITY_DN27938_c0_g1_i1:49-2205(+)